MYGLFSDARLFCITLFRLGKKVHYTNPYPAPSLPTLRRGLVRFPVCRLAGVHMSNIRPLCPHAPEPTCSHPRNAPP